MEPGVIPHDDLSPDDPRDEFDRLMAISADPEVLVDPDGRPAGGAEEAEGEGELLAVLIDLRFLLFVLELVEGEAGVGTVAGGRHPSPELRQHRLDLAVPFVAGVLRLEDVDLVLPGYPAAAGLFLDPYILHFLSHFVGFLPPESEASVRI